MDGRTFASPSNPTRQPKVSLQENQQQSFKIRKKNTRPASDAHLVETRNARDEFLPTKNVAPRADFDTASRTEASAACGRPLSSLWRISQILRDPSSCRSETSSQERAAFGGRSPPQSERARAVGKSTRAEIPTPGLLGGKDLLCMVCRPLFLLTPARGAPRPCTGQPPFVLAVLSP